MELETATPTEVAEIVAAFSRKEATQYRRPKGIINITAAGTGQTADPDLVIPSQYDMLLERVTFGGNALILNTTIGVYENQVADTDLLEWVQINASLKYSDSFSNRMYITANSKIIIAVTGATPNLQVTYNLQGRLIPAN